MKFTKVKLIKDGVYLSQGYQYKLIGKHSRKEWSANYGLPIIVQQKVSAQNLDQLSEFRSFEKLFVLLRVSTSKKWVDNFSCVFKPLTTLFLKRGKN